MMTKLEVKIEQPGTLDVVLEIRRLLHEVNNVLTGVLISAGLLKHLVPLTPPSGRYASEIEGSAERAGVLVGEVREAVHRLQERLGGAANSTQVCDVRPSLGRKSGED